MSVGGILRSTVAGLIPRGRGKNACNEALLKARAQQQDGIRKYKHPFIGQPMISRYMIGLEGYFKTTEL